MEAIIAGNLAMGQRLDDLLQNYIQKYKVLEEKQAIMERNLLKIQRCRTMQNDAEQTTSPDMHVEIMLQMRSLEEVKMDCATLKKMVNLPIKYIYIKSTAMCDLCEYYI